MAVCCVDSETIFHEVTVENSIVRDGRFAGAFYRNKANHSMAPVLPGVECTVSGTDVLSETHDLEKRSRGRLVQKTS